MDVFVDGELESLLGMFNFDQCSSSKEEKPQDEMLSLSSLYNGHLRHHHQNNRKQLHVENPHNSNSNCDVTRQELVKAKKKQRVNQESNTVDESNTNWRDGQSQSNSSDDEKASVTSAKGKTRATKGTATDPQSLYALKRRKKINERLKTQQNLVPNGTKVDISTMLEEAVHYVKFLQLQIKVCTIFFSLWMYSPLAYSGLDMGFITTFCLGSCEGLVIQVIYNLIVKKPI
ncbi:BnaC03g57760D [Brassica napus]|uniref:BnaC03g57760D protein n=1 Tax=Brassica napus TaxID=3708 RepID=A0A078FFN1_BRANA|nr:Unknown [Brassica napus]CAA8392023.1 Unknown [Brassica napus]CAA8403663.1 Unknown [Brassica napus]CDY11802.1 BnaC03g57760D [Brassica napus]